MWICGQLCGTATITYQIMNSVTVEINIKSSELEIVIKVAPTFQVIPALPQILNVD